MTDDRSRTIGSALRTVNQIEDNPTRSISFGVSNAQAEVLGAVLQKEGMTLSRLVEAAFAYHLPGAYGVPWPAFPRPRHGGGPSSVGGGPPSNRMQMKAVKLTADQWAAVYAALERQADRLGLESPSPRDGRQTLLVEEALTAYLRDQMGVDLPRHVRLAREGAAIAFSKSEQQ